MTINPADVLAVLPRGRANGVSVGDLAYAIAGRAQLGLTWAASAAKHRKVREAVEALRRDGHPICATPEHGYYLAETEAELSETIAFLRSRAMTSLTQIARLRRVSLPVLMGQMQIELAAEQSASQPGPECRRMAAPDSPAEYSESVCRRCDGGPCSEGSA